MSISGSDAASGAACFPQALTVRLATKQFFSKRAKVFDKMDDAIFEPTALYSIDGSGHCALPIADSGVYRYKGATHQ